MAQAKLTDAQIVAKHYVIAAIWADCEEGTNPRAPASTVARARWLAWEFLEIVGPAAIELAKRAHDDRGYGSHPDCGTDRPWLAAMGHDLWLTAGGHGTGFWDREELHEKHADYLTQCAERFEGIYATFYRGWLYLEGTGPLALDSPK